MSFLASSIWFKPDNIVPNIFFGLDIYLQIKKMIKLKVTFYICEKENLFLNQKNVGVWDDKRYSLSIDRSNAIKLFILVDTFYVGVNV